MIPLNQIHVAAPCRQSWDEMDGDEQKRFCQSCRQNVYNISEMSRAEAERLIREKEGRLCVRFYCRTDGTVMTKDCPVGLRAVRLRAAAVFSGLVTLLLGGVAAKTSHADPPATMGAPMAPPAPKAAPHLIMGKPVNPATMEHNTAAHPRSAPQTQARLGQMSLESFEHMKHSTSSKRVKVKTLSPSVHTSQKERRKSGLK